jgi:hypothetical protein
LLPPPAQSAQRAGDAAYTIARCRRAVAIAHRAGGGDRVRTERGGRFAIVAVAGISVVTGAVAACAIEFIATAVSAIIAVSIIAVVVVVVVVAIARSFLAVPVSVRVVVSFVLVVFLVRGAAVASKHKSPLLVAPPTPHLSGCKTKGRANLARHVAGVARQGDRLESRALSILRERVDQRIADRLRVEG